uniref:HAT C-terminal dimerisation domain-containing protein n=1 Tax=Anopheles christyi TaxID=43041 RepID=A0A182K8L0_9DIPT
MTLKLDEPTSWYSTLEMLDRFMICKEAILHCLVEVNVTSNLEGKDWLIIEQSLKVLQVLDAAVNEVMAEKVVTVSKPGVLYHMLVHRLETMATEQNILMDVTALTEELLNGIKENLSFIKNNKLLSQAILLDPRYKGEGFMQDEESFQKTYETVIEEIASLQSDDNTPMEVGKEADEAPSQCFEDMLYNLFESHKRSKHDGTALKLSAQCEVDFYLKAKHLDRKADPLQWWENNKHFYPNLYKLASKILCTPASCVSLNGCIAKAELECRERKNRLLPKKIQPMVFLKYNHHRYKHNSGDA